MPVAGFRTWICLSLIWAWSGCALPAGDVLSPEGAYYESLRSQERGEAFSRWERLHPPQRALFDRWAAAEWRIVKLLDSRPLSDDYRREARTTMGLAARGEHGSGRSLFHAVIATEPMGELTLLQRIGARVRTVEMQDARATLTTWAGDRVHLVRHTDDVWYLGWPQEVASEVAAATRQAEGNLQRLETPATP